jgi:type I restriction enzyme R subunit
VNGVEVEFARPDGSIGYKQIRVIDFDTSANNDFVACNQFTIEEGRTSAAPTSSCS